MVSQAVYTASKLESEESSLFRSDLVDLVVRLRWGVGEMPYSVVSNLQARAFCYRGSRKRLWAAIETSIFMLQFSLTGLIRFKSKSEGKENKIVGWGGDGCLVFVR